MRTWAVRGGRSARQRSPGRADATPRAETTQAPLTAKSLPRRRFAGLAIVSGDPGRMAVPSGDSNGAVVQCNGLDSAKSESGAEEKLKERMRLRRQQVLRPQSDRSEGSATLAHLNTRYVDSGMHVRAPISEGVESRFMTPTDYPPQTSPAPLRREISQEQVAKYKAIQSSVIANEKKHADTHVALYHAQDPRMRIAQDVYKRVYARHAALKMPQDFHFLRFPGPDDKEYRDSLPEFLQKDMGAHGMIDDNINPTKGSIVSANLSAFGGIGHPGEETFHYFQTGRGQTPPPVTKLMEDFLPKFGLDPSGAEDLYKKAEKLNDTPEGNLLQVLVPKSRIDDVAYAAHPHGMPHDDEILDRLHAMGSIKYPKVQGQLTREKMNDEMTRKLADIRDVSSRRDKIPPLSSLPVTGGTPGPSSMKGTRKLGLTPPSSDEMTKRVKDRQDALLLHQADELGRDTSDRFQNSPLYRLSTVMNDYVHGPHRLQHPEAQMQAHRLASNPEHFGGQGIRSHHDIMRIQNRPNFLQARLHMSDEGMLNPYSGIKVIRHTTMEPERVKQYESLIDQYVEDLHKSVSPTMHRQRRSKL